MRDGLTPGAERALQAARRAAAGQPAVEPRHLLIGLWSDEDSPAMVLARRCQFEPSGWLPATIPEEIDASVSFSLAAEGCLRAARRLARNYLVDKIVTTELMLVGILQSESSLAAELAGAGFQLARLDELVLAPLTAPVPLADLPEPQAAPADRILDANANRAREALRVLEEYARFVLDDRILTTVIKDIRHDLATTLTALPIARLVASRDTASDVGTTTIGANEYARGNLSAVVAANCKRLQESLRCLEEYGKLSDGNVARRIEQIRYRSYTLEKALVRDRPLSAAIAAARLYFLVGAAQCRRPFEETVQAALAGGVHVVQLREKTIGDRELLDRARVVRRLTRAANALFIVNDRPDIARLSEADGVHLGQDDLTVAAARRLLGPHALIGVSTHNFEQLQQAVINGADYVGVGPTFASGTKSFNQLAGLEFARQAAGATSLPAFALGGVTESNVHQVLQAGISRIAVSAAIAQANDPMAVAKQLSSALTH